MTQINEKAEKLRCFVAVYLILTNDKNQILLAKRQNTGYMDGLWALPAGHLEKGETLEDAVKREAEEEIGVEPIDCQYIYTLHRIAAENIGQKDYLDFFFVASEYEGKIENKEPEKCSELNWFNLDDLPEDIVPYISLALDNIKSGRLGLDEITY